MQLGVTKAEALSFNTNTAVIFKDVPTTFWAYNYIEYCAQQGIISGYGNGKFGPNDTLTGYQWAKMLLSAVGFGVNKEYNGVNWAINAARDGLKYGVFTAKVDATAGSTPKVITRDVATGMAFNTLVGIPKVTYAALIGDYIDGTGNVTSRTSRPAMWSSTGLDVTGVTHFQLAKTFKGQLSKVTWNTDLQDYVYKISDTDYTRSGLDGTIAQEEIAHQGYNVDVNYYTDDFGYIVNAKAVKAALSDFVIALDFGSDNSKVFTSTPYVYLLKMDGTTEQVPVAALVDGTTTYTFTGESIPRRTPRQVLLVNLSHGDRPGTA
jgi:hypothetical protein